MKIDQFRSQLFSVISVLAIFLIMGVPLTYAQTDAPAPLKQLGEAFVQVAEKVTPAVVNINSFRKGTSGPAHGDIEEFFKGQPFPFKDFFDKLPKREREGGGGGVPQQFGMGSGVIVSSDGVILTNSHVVKDADEVKVTLSDKRTFVAKVKGADSDSDIAVIKIDATGLPTAKLGDSSKLRVGEVVLAIGNPFGLNQTVTSGIVSAQGRTNVGIIEYEDFIQTDAAINPGNSGGPLVNIYGEVVGINTAIASRSGGYMGVGFAIPSNSANLIMEDLLKEGKVRRGLLGVNIQDVTDELAKSFGRTNTDGALVSKVIEGSPAEKAGVKDGDIITKFNGEPVRGAAQLKNLVGKIKPDSAATLTVFRNKQTVDLNVKIAEKTPQALAASGKQAAPASQTSDELGIDIESLSSAAAAQLGLKEGDGVRVKDTKPGAIGARMGLRNGDVILEVDGKGVKDVSGFNTAVAEAKSHKVIRLKVQRGQGVIYLATNLG